jgi:2-polyprenyl-3-methyl-5-hydroxy-6-metoxy-1,4-benzoquinol methylase
MLRERGYAVNVYDPIYWPDKSVLQKTYDFIVASEVAEHFHNPLAEFQKLHGLLNKGGALVLMTLLVTNKIDFEAWYYRKDPTHVVFYSEKTLNWIKENLGFTSIESDSTRLIVFRKAAGA